MSAESPLRRSRIPVRPAQFDLFPYFATRLGSSVIHFMILPAEWDVDELTRFATLQTATNRLAGALVLDHAMTGWFWPDSETEWTSRTPRCTTPVTGMLRPCVPIPPSAELDERQRRLIDRIKGVKLGKELDTEYIARPATDAERESLDGTQPGGVPNGLERCPGCGRWFGSCLHPRDRDSVVTICCECVNDTLCAECHQPLADKRLTANFLDPEDNSIVPVPGFLALIHVCKEDARHLSLSGIPEDDSPENTLVSRGIDP